MKNDFLSVEQQEMVVTHLSFAENMARRFRDLGAMAGVSVEDLRQEACLGLCEAALRYVPQDAGKAGDDEAGKSGDEEGHGAVAFETYAYSWCRKYILLAIRRGGESMTSDDDVETVGGGISDDGGAYGRECVIKVEALLMRLTMMERTVVCYVYGIDSLQADGDSLQADGDSLQAPVELKDFKEIAAIMHLQVMRVKEIYRSAMRKMRG